jgi:hypothetical protein
MDADGETIREEVTITIGEEEPAPRMGGVVLVGMAGGVCLLAFAGA